MGKTCEAQKQSSAFFLISYAFSSNRQIEDDCIALGNA